MNKDHGPLKASFHAVVGVTGLNKWWSLFQVCPLKASFHAVVGVTGLNK